MIKLSTIAILSGLVTYNGLAFADTAVTDLGVVDKSRILYWLEKRGELSANASDKEKEEAYSQFIANRYHKHNHILPKGLTKNITNKVSPFLEKRLIKAPTVSRVNEDIEGATPVLAILIDFQDLKHDNNGLTSFDTDMYYTEYPREHYEDLIFSPTGFTGPQGQTLESAHQYYLQESGDSLILSGNVFGWVTANNNAKYYGENQNSTDNSSLDDVNVGELVIEAVEKAIAQNTIDLSDYDKISQSDHDGDGDLNEPDGVVDHLMIFHSSIGEESGGGDLGDDAIWSHRSAVFTSDFDAVPVQGSNVKIFSYTITPIDSSIGVVVHEFGHSLGVPDEYDLTNDETGAPVQAWSVMASGSWLGFPRGSKPSSFSPYAKEYFQNQYGGNWTNQQTVNFSETLNETLSLSSASTHNGSVDQIRVDLPILQKDFGQPYSGNYQYYSNTGDQIENSLRFNATVGINNPVLNMKARWEIEQDYDFVLVRVNNVAIAGNHTNAISPFYSTIGNYITGNSLGLAGSTQGLGWVDLTFDLSSYSGQNVNIDIVYATDTTISGYGFAVDDIQITSGSTTTFSNGAETLAPVSLNGFSRVTDTVDGDEHYYYIQLRDHNGTDSALPTIGYDPGVLVWYRNENIDNNNVSDHAGELFIGVVDADQNLITRNGTTRNTEAQIRDAAFSLYPQTVTNTDTELTNNVIFDDSVDYSAPLQPKSGIILPSLGLNMEIITQASDSSTASILLTGSDTERATSNNQSNTNNSSNASNSSGSESSGGSIYWLTMFVFGLLVNRKVMKKRVIIRNPVK